MLLYVCIAACGIGGIEGAACVRGWYKEQKRGKGRAAMFEPELEEE